MRDAWINFLCIYDIVKRDGYSTVDFEIYWGFVLMVQAISSTSQAGQQKPDFEGNLRCTAVYYKDHQLHNKPYNR